MTRKAKVAAAATVQQMVAVEPVAPVASNDVQRRIASTYLARTAIFKQTRGKVETYEERPVILSRNPEYKEDRNGRPATSWKVTAVDTEGNPVEYKQVKLSDCRFEKSRLIQTLLDVGEADPVFAFKWLRYTFDATLYSRGTVASKRDKVDEGTIDDLAGPGTASTYTVPAPVAPQQQQSAASLDLTKLDPAQLAVLRAMLT